MNFLTKPLEEFALRQFDEMGADKGDWFFTTFGPGNLTFGTSQPHERFKDYEYLLKTLNARNKEKYDAIHKGTAFYFLSWLAFDLKNYEKGLYYIDAAISEDVKNIGTTWATRPAAGFLRLEYQTQVAGRVILDIRKFLENEITRFNTLSGVKPLNTQLFIDKFVVPLLAISSTRTIISAFYVFLLEFDERSSELNLRSTQGSSIGPIITHLFSGCIIFESILKNLYPCKNDGSAAKTLGDIFQTTAFRKDFIEGIQTTASSLQEILNGIQDYSIKTAFSTTAKLRNTTGHNLTWDNVFDSTDNFQKLVHQIINALFFVIEKTFVR